MSHTGTDSDGAMISRLERLACGELDQADRQRVLAWLEEDPRRWRICGLAFMEAQSWSEALSGWPGLPGTPGKPCRQVSVATPKSLGRPLAVLVSAACLLVAFSLGVAWRDIAGQVSTPQQPGTNAVEGHRENAARSGQPMLASLTVRQGSAFGPASSIQIPVTPHGPAAERDPSALDEIPEYVRSQWERRGFRLTAERRYLFAHLSNGQPIVVPVDQVLVHSMPQKVN